MDYESIGQLATNVLRDCFLMENECQAKNIAPPTLEAGAGTAFWSENVPELVARRKKALGTLEQLTALLQGPHEFLHEFVAPNWDHGALYAFLQSQTLEYINSSSGRRASLSSLSNQSGIPDDKLSRILGLLRCKNIVHELEPGVFSLTAVSEELINDGDFRAWVEFQLFETRVASAYLGEALTKKPNDYVKGISGFKRGWGMEMYDWHTTRPEKGDRFRRAMRGVSKSLDPADTLIRRWFNRNTSSNRSKVVEIGGRYGFASTSLVEENEELLFEIRCDSQDFLRRGEALVEPKSTARIAFAHVPSLFDPIPSEDSTTVLVYVIRNLLWNWADEDAIKLLQALLPTLKDAPSVRILVTDGVSPIPKDFPPHVEIAYRRRDITVMTMHNVKQRTQVEWLAMFAQVDPNLKVASSFENSSHVYKGLWELSWEP